jgi:hypothetical protein
MLLCASREDACDLLFMLTLTGARLAIFGSQSARVVRGGNLLWDTFPPKATDLRMPGNEELCHAAMQKRSPSVTVTIAGEPQSSKLKRGLNLANFLG